MKLAKDKACWLLLAIAAAVMLVGYLFVPARDLPVWLTGYNYGDPTPPETINKLETP